jgi:Mrp family chromosome partitioning ATPase
MVIIDSPSSGYYVDGAIIASKGSGALIVAKANKTSYMNIERIKWQMKNVAANIIGIVINRVSYSDYKTYFIMDNINKIRA